jgi:hypothetical protein
MARQPRPRSSWFSVPGFLRGRRSRWHGDDSRRMGRPLTPPGKVVYGCSKNAEILPLCATFLRPLGRISGNAAGSVSRGRIMGSDVRCGRPGDSRTEWHRCTEVCHRGGGSRLTPGRSPALGAPRGRTVLWRGTKDARRGRAGGHAVTLQMVPAEPRRMRGTAVRSNATPLPNSGDGIHIEGDKVSQTMIGGTVDGAGNFISGSATSPQGPYALVPPRPRPPGFVVRTGPCYNRNDR